MGVQMMDSGKGGKKALDTEINLIPMIDLLIVSVAFLLITACWTQLSRLDVTQQMPGQDQPSDRPPEDKVRLTLRITEQGFMLASSAGETLPIEKKGEDYDFEKLRTELKTVHERDPERKDIIVAPENGVLYKNIVKAMDTALSEGFPELSVSDGSTN